MLVGDLTGDWREEIVTVLPGELRIYKTTTPATDRRVTLLDDHIYRLDIAMESMGYSALPTTSYWLGAGATTLKLSGPDAGLVPEAASACVATIVAPTGQALTGTLRLSTEGEATVEPASLLVSVSPGQVARFPFTVRAPKMSPLAGKAVVTVTASLESPGAKSVQTKAALPLADVPLSGVPMVEAENFVEQSGGEVHLRTDKPGASAGKAFSHWDNKGHRLGWQINVPQAGRYALVIRYACGGESDRSLLVDGKPIPGAERLRFPPSTSTSTGDWSHFVVRGADGKPAPLDLSAGPHKIVMENLAAQPLNLDTLAFVPL
jgi:hypothetical protein